MKRILIVEDEQNIREFELINLRRVGYETVDVDSDVMVAQTVIVGTVPETYVNLGHLTTTEGWDQYGTETGD